MTLDQRIEKDLAERRNGNSITAAKQLAPLAKDGDGFQFSTKGLPTYFTGKRDAETVFVQLNPGMNADLADKRWNFDTKHFNHSSLESFAKDYMDSRINYGKNDRLRYDSFDVKQAAFLSGWQDCGISFPENINWNDLAQKDLYWLEAKESVLMDKLQLELIPYASQKFEINKEQLHLLFPYVDILLDEIIRKDRKYVIFGGNFDDLFIKYNEKCPDTFDLSRDRKSIDLTGLKKKNNTDDWTAKLYYRVININHNNKTQKALIAYTFPKQNLGNAFAILQEYGKQCYEAFINTQF